MNSENKSTNMYSKINTSKVYETSETILNILMFFIRGAEFV